MKKPHFDQAAENLFSIATAWHEASHTIVYLYYLKKVDRVHIISDQDQYGLTLITAFDPSESDDKILTKMLILQELQAIYAGLIGEKIYYKEICGLDHFPMHLRSGSSSDIREASRLIQRYRLSTPGRDRYQLKIQIQKDAKKVLQDNWGDVRLIAHALCQTKDLSYQAIKDILTKKSKNRDVWKRKFKMMSFLYASEEITFEQIKQGLAEVR